MRAIRGAIATVENQPEKIGEAALVLVNQICSANKLSADDIVMLLFSATDDLDAAYPAQAVRLNGFSQLPMMCLQEMKVAHAMKGCIRVVVTIHRDLPVLNHVYLGDAKKLRPDWVGD